MELDIPFVREHFPAFGSNKVPGHFFESAGGSFPCRQTVDALGEFYRQLKVQPGSHFPISREGMERMQNSKQRWATALGVADCEVGFGPSTSQNTYVLATAFRELLQPGDEVVVTNQDHEANTGAIRRAVIAAGATLREWQVDTETGLLSTEDLSALVNRNTRLVCIPHSSNITGQKNDVESISAIVHAQDAWLMVDGVSFAPHAIVDISSIGADIYVFSLYKVYSVHQGVMVIRRPVLEQLPNQGHYFKDELDVSELMVPAGPDHAQIAAASGVLDYIEALAVHHNGPVDDLRSACDFVSSLWQEHEKRLLSPLFEFFASVQSTRVLGTRVADDKRCPLVSFLPSSQTAADLARRLCEENILLSWGDFYAPRLLNAVGIDPATGVVRVSMAHYNNEDDVAALIDKLQALL